MVTRFPCHAVRQAPVDLPAARACHGSRCGGRAPGSGIGLRHRHHASTALCLSWLDAEPLQDLEVIDYGCGAGTLAIAALKLGARRAHAYDIDPQALLATGENALDNGVAGRLQIHETELELPTHCALLMANILADVLIRLQPRFAALLPRAGRILLSGLLQEQEAEVSDVFARDFELCRCAQREGWIALAGTRR